MSSNNNGASLDQKLNQLINGVQTTVTSGQTFPINGQSYKQSTLLAALKEQVAPFDAAESAHEVLKKAVVDREAARPAALAFYNAVVSVLLANYGNDTATLATFGLAPRKAKRQLTSEEKLKAAAKAKATRALRGTMGPKKKEAIKATGPVTITSSIGSSAPTPSTSVAAPVAVPSPTAPSSTAVNGADPTNGVVNGASH